MAYVRKIKFSYYTICLVNDKDGSDPVRFDFESWIKKVDECGLEKKEVETDGLIARLEEYEGDKFSHIWKLRFLKLRDTNIPSIVKTAEEAKPIELKDDEYIGEDLLMIYDPENQVAMLQCNRMSMTKGRLEKYINKVWGNPDERIVLLHISKQINQAQLKKKNFKYLEVRLANIHATEDKNRPFGRIVNSYYEIGGKAGSFVCSLGRGQQKEDGLSREQIPIMLDDIYENLDIVSNATLKVKDDDAASIDIVDLLDNTLNDYLDFRLEKRTTLEFQYATRIMIERYNNKKEEINQLLA